MTCSAWVPSSRCWRTPPSPISWCNTHKNVWVERNGKLTRANIRFRDDEHLLQVNRPDRLGGGAAHRRLLPMVDARLADGSRVERGDPAPLHRMGPTSPSGSSAGMCSPRRTSLRNDTLTRSMLTFLQGCVRARLNILVSGGTGSGKTTFLNMLSEAIPLASGSSPSRTRRSCSSVQPHVVRLETRPPNIEGSGTVSQRHLVNNSLRMRPDRINHRAKVRGEEAVDMLQAMNTRP